jgi:transposase
MKTTILSLVEQGWSFRRIHRELGVDREAVSRCVRLEASKPANLPTGSPEAGVKTGQTRPPGPTSIVAPFREVVEQKLQIGLDAYRIFQDLRGEHGYGGGYDAVKRFVRRLRAAEPTVYARIEVAPGQEAQVDFGTGAPTLHPTTGQYRRPHLFKMTLSFSRHSYEETVWRQDVETFIRCHERAFQALGGVTAIVRLDNLKAGVARACLYDPDINKTYAEYAAHAGFVPLPCQPRRPEHKGKIERGIGYTKNAVKGRTFGSIEEQNEFLRTWNRTVARVRIHGTTKQQVWARYIELERPALKPLPPEGFSMCRSGTRKVHPDGHVEVDKAYYSVPHRYVGQEVEVRWDEHMVRILAGHEIVAVHHKLPVPGRFTTRPEHLPARKSRTQEQYQAHLLARAEKLGPGALGWALGALGNRGPLALRPIQGVLGLCRRHPPEEVDWACRQALMHASFRYQTVRELLDRRQGQLVEPSLIQEHDLIRPLAEYGQIISPDKEENP